MANVQYYGTGRRKYSVARVRLVAGEGNIKVNGKNLEDYFNYETLIREVKQPLVVTGNENKYDVIVKVEGGGYTGQAGAIRHGLSRALLKADEDFRPALKAEGFLTRDSRMKERKKYGLKAARRAPQFSKRYFVLYIAKYIQTPRIQYSWGFSMLSDVFTFCLLSNIYAYFKFYNTQTILKQYPLFISYLPLF